MCILSFFQFMKRCTRWFDPTIVEVLMVWTRYFEKKQDFTALPISALFVSCEKILFCARSAAITYAAPRHPKALYTKLPVGRAKLPGMQ